MKLASNCRNAYQHIALLNIRAISARSKTLDPHATMEHARTPETGDRSWQTLVPATV